MGMVCLGSGSLAKVCTAQAHIGCHSSCIQLYLPQYLNEVPAKPVGNKHVVDSQQHMKYGMYSDDMT